MAAHVVIPCRRGPNEELRCALRSIHANCPWVDDVTVYGHPPDWYTGRKVDVAQGPNKYDNTTRAFEAFVADDVLPTDVVLWNDDFYAIAPTDRSPDANLGPLADRIDLRIARNPRSAGTAHTRGAHEALTTLRAWGYENPLSYDLHAPMTLHRAHLAHTLECIRHAGIGGTHKRTIHGNIVGLQGETWAADVKIRDHRAPWPTGPWISTSDGAWAAGHGAKLRALLPEPSRWET
jgi:hypothetical protein